MLETVKGILSANTVGGDRRFIGLDRGVYVLARQPANQRERPRTGSPAYMREIIRAGIDAVDEGQLEAAKSAQAWAPGVL